MHRVALLVVTAMVALLTTAPAVLAAPPSAFTGHWEAIDPAGGSNLDAYILVGGNIFLTDDRAETACAGLSNQAFTSFLTSTIFDGNEMDSTMRWARCGTVNRFFGGFQIAWFLNDLNDADPSNDILTNEFGEIYSRVP